MPEPLGERMSRKFGSSGMEADTVSGQISMKCSMPLRSFFDMPAGNCSGSGLLRSAAVAVRCARSC